MENDSKCSCLYRALLTTSESYNIEDARSKYKILINKTSSLPNPIRGKVITLLNTAKETLGNLSRERIYFNEGTYDTAHKCNNNATTIELIEGLARQSQSQMHDAMDTTKTGSKVNSSKKCAEEDKVNNNKDTEKVEKEQGTDVTNVANPEEDSMSVRQVTDHRFRGKRLKLTIILDPGNVRITEDEERVTTMAREKVAEYLSKLKKEKPRRINHIIRMRPHLIQLLK